MITEYDWWKHQVPKILDNEDNSAVQTVVNSGWPYTCHVPTTLTSITEKHSSLSFLLSTHKTWKTFRGGCMVEGTIPIHILFIKIHTLKILRPHLPNARHPNCLLIHPSMMDFQMPWRACKRAVGWPFIV